MYVMAEEFGDDRAYVDRLTAEELVHEYGWDEADADECVRELGWGDVGSDPDWYEDDRGTATYRDHVDDELAVTFDAEGRLQQVEHTANAAWTDDPYLVRVEAEQPLAYLEQAVVEPDPAMDWAAMRERLTQLYEEQKEDGAL